MDPHAVQVCRFTPARPNAGGISVAAVFPSGRNPMPSSSSSASNLPGTQHRAYGVLVHAQQVGHGAQVGSETDNGADVQIAVGPTIEAMTDARRKGVVHGGVA